jgi:hypothetical protein
LLPFFLFDKLQFVVSNIACLNFPDHDKLKFVGLFLYRMPAPRSQTNLRTVAFDLVLHARGLPRLRVNQLHVGDVYESFLVDDAPTPIALGIRPLMALDHAGAFDLDLALRRRYLQHAPAPAFVAAGDNHYLIVLPDL